MEHWLACGQDVLHWGRYLWPAFGCYLFLLGKHGDLEYEIGVYTSLAGIVIYVLSVWHL